MSKYYDQDGKELREKDLSIEERIHYAILYKEEKKVKAFIEAGFEIDPVENLKLIMITDDFKMITLLEDLNYPFKDDHKCIEEYIKYGSGLTEVARFMLDKGAVVSWKAIQMAANRYNLKLVKLLAKEKNDFFPVD